MASHMNTEKTPPWALACAGATGAVVANALVYPLDMVKTRLQVQVRSQDLAVQFSPDAFRYKSTWDAVSKIVQDDGMPGLYAGVTGALIGVASTNFAYFYSYSIVRSLYVSSRRLPNTTSTPVELTLGAFAGAVAQIITIPVALVTTRQQTQSKTDKKGMLGTAQEVINSDDGYLGLWKGLKASLVLVINPAITYGAYQRLRDMFYPGIARLRPREAFLLGAMSKALATLVTQPLIVAKVGLQSKPPANHQEQPFKTFVEVMQFIIRNEGFLGLFKGITPQIAKGLLVQGLLMMTKERLEILFVLLYHYCRRGKSRHLDNLPISKVPIVRPAVMK